MISSCVREVLVVLNTVYQRFHITLGPIKNHDGITETMSFNFNLFTIYIMKGLIDNWRKWLPLIRLLHQNLKSRLVFLKRMQRKTNASKEGGRLREWDVTQN